MEVSEASALARRLLADALPQRWNHVQGVAARAELFVERQPGWQALVAAAYLHDVGYAPGVVDSGFHPLDGARYLRGIGCDEAIVNLVAHHSGAAEQAEMRGFGAEFLAELPKNDLLPHHQLHFCDLTTSIDGESISFDARIEDLRARKDSNSPAVRYLNNNETRLRRMVAEIWAELGVLPEALSQAG